MPEVSSKQEGAGAMSLAEPVPSMGVTTHSHGGKPAARPCRTLARAGGQVGLAGAPAKVIWLLPMPVATWAMRSLVLRAWALGLRHSSSFSRATSCLAFSRNVDPLVLAGQRSAVLEVLQGLDGEDVPRHCWATRSEPVLSEVVQAASAPWPHVPPVLAMVVEPLHHAHDLRGRPPRCRSGL